MYGVELFDVHKKRITKFRLGHELLKTVKLRELTLSAWVNDNCGQIYDRPKNQGCPNTNMRRSDGIFR